MPNACTPIAATTIVAIISIFLSISCLIIGIMLIIKLRTDNALDKEKQKTNFSYFYHTALTTTICHMLCCIAVSIYSIWILISATFELAEIITLRALPTVFWFVSKISLIWIWNGRLYYTFQGGIMQSSYVFFIIINVLIAVCAPGCIFLGYFGVYKGNVTLIVSGFQGFRFLYISLTFTLLYMWCRKMLRLQKVKNLAPVVDSIIRIDSSTTGVSIGAEQMSQKDIKLKEAQEKKREMQFFVTVTAKNLILVLYISISGCLVAFWWLMYDYVLDQNCLTLDIPMNMFSVDCVNNSICVYLLFRFGTDLYKKMCKTCDNCCVNILSYCL